MSRLPTVIPFLFALALPLSARAGEVTVAMRADRTELSVGETLELRIEADVHNVVLEDVMVPDLTGFRIVGRRISRPMQFRFGFGNTQVIQSSTVHELTLQALEPGRIRIEPAKVRAGGRLYSSDPIVVNVRSGPAASPHDPSGFDLSTPPPADTSGSTEGMRFDSTAFLRTVVDKSDPYIGEQVTATVYLYVRGGLRSAPTLLREPSSDGFWVHDLLPPARTLQATQEAVGGIPFRVYVLRQLAIFPLRSGKLTFGAPKVQLESGTAFGAFGRGGGGLTREGEPVTITARALPDPDRQDAVVGTYTIETEIDRTEVLTGDAVTFRVRARGTGNLHDVKLALPDQSGLRILEPRVIDDIRTAGDKVGGSRTFEYLIVPERPGRYKLPSLGFDRFDPTTRRYHSVHSEPRGFVATGTAVDTPRAEGSPSKKPREELRFGPIRTRSELRRASNPISREVWYAWALAVPPALWLGILAIGFARRGVEAKRSASAPKVAVRTARRSLDQAMKRARNGDARGFYGEVAQALKRLLEMHLGEPVGSLTHRQLEARLIERNMTEDLARRIVDELDGCDFARFSAAGVTVDEMEDCAARTRALFDRLALSERATETEA